MLSHGESKRTLVAGIAALALMAALVLAAVVPLVVATAAREEVRSNAFDAYVWQVTRFTLIQAGLSTLLSVGLAVPLASALARRQRFVGRPWLIRLLALPLGLPQIVAALGIIQVWGRQGLLNNLLAGAGLAQPVSIYGLAGILLAHVFFNLPLAARLMLLELERLPGEYWALAGELGMGRLVGFPLPRMAGDRPRRPRHSGADLHAVRHILHHRAAARRRSGRHDDRSGRSIRRCASTSILRERSCWRCSRSL